MKKTLSMLAVLGVMAIGIQSAQAFCWSNLNPANWGHCKCQNKCEKQCDPCKKVQTCDPCGKMTGAASPCNPCQKKQTCDPCKKIIPCEPCQKARPTCDACDRLQEMNK